MTAQHNRARRTRIVRARITPDQHTRWDREREARGHRDLSAFIRATVETALTGRPDRADRPRPQAPAVTAHALRQLYGIANNINQIARWCHVEKRAPDVDVLGRLVDVVRAAIDAIQTGPTPVPRPHVDSRQDPDDTTTHGRRT